MLMALLGSLAACASTSAPNTVSPRNDPFARIPYWQDPFWQVNLYHAIQAAVHRPDDMGDGSTTDTRATVGFTVANGDTQDLTIVSSTGDAGLDQLVLQQVGSAKVPPPFGGNITEPHHFELGLDVLTLTEWLKYNIYYAIDQYKVYPKSAIMNAASGSTTVDFDYLDGKAENITLVKASNGVGLNQASLQAVEKAQFPTPIPAYLGRTLHMEAIFCYSLNGSPKCPQGNNVILVEAMRVRVY